MYDYQNEIYFDQIKKTISFFFDYNLNIKIKFVLTELWKINTKKAYTIHFWRS